MTAVVEIEGAPVQGLSVHLQSGMLARGYSAQLRSRLGCVTRNACEGNRRPWHCPGRARA